MTNTRPSRLSVSTRRVAIFSVFAAFALLAFALFVASCSGSSQDAKATGPFKVAIFVPGVVAGSPTYEMMVNGVNAAAGPAKEKFGRDLEVKVVEGGFNQSEWQTGVTALASTKEYDLIVSTNPSLPEIAAAVATAFPEQKFLVLSGTLEGNPAIKTIGFDQFQQGYLDGYFAALVSSSTLPKANKQHVIGLLAGQEYPEMNDEIRPGFLAGAQAVNPDFTVDFRVLGNWYDAAKAEELARSMIAAGADAILTIAGGGNQGVVSAAQNGNAYAVWFDSTAASQAPGVILGGSIVKQTDIATEAVLKAIEGTLDYGNATILGVKEGAVSFDFDNPDVVKHTPADILAAERALVDDVISGKAVISK